MPPKIDPDTTSGAKLLRMFRKLMLDGRKHFQSDLAEELQCSPQTIIRLAAEIESVVGTGLEYGMEDRRRWYRMHSDSAARLGVESEELRYLGICRDLAAASLPEQIKKRVDETIFNLSVLMAEPGYARQGAAPGGHITFFSKGRIDYTPHYESIERLVRAAREKRICRVRYKSPAQAESKTHHFAPGQIISLGGTLYVLGGRASEDGDECLFPTHLAIHRIQKVDVLNEKYSFKLPDARPEAFGLPWHEPKSFRIYFTPGYAATYVRERIWADNQVITEADDGGVILEIATSNEIELLAWVRSFGEEARVL